MPQRRYRNNLSNYSAYNNIGTIGFNPVTFNPAVFEPKENDMTLLAQGMARDEQRRDNAFTTYEALNNKLGELTKTFSDDPETKKWFDDNNKRITDIVNQSIQAGDWERAMLDSKRLAGEFVNSREFQDRQRSWAEYNQNLTDVKNRLQNGKISQETFDWWQKNNGYAFDSSTGKYKKLQMPVDDIDWREETVRGFAMIKPSQIQSQRTLNRKREGVGYGEKDPTLNPNEIGSKDTGWTRGSSLQQVKEQDIIDNMERGIFATADGRRRLNQDYNVKYDAYKDLVSEYSQLLEKKQRGEDVDEEQLRLLEDEKKIADKFWNKNGSPLTLEQYYARMVLNQADEKNGQQFKWGFAGTMAYINKNDVRSDNDILGSFYGGAHNAGRANYDENGNLIGYYDENGQYHGIGVEQKSNLGQKEGDAKTAGDAAKNNLTRHSKAGYAE